MKFENIYSFIMMTEPKRFFCTQKEQKEILVRSYVIC